MVFQLPWIHRWILLFTTADFPFPSADFALLIGGTGLLLAKVSSTDCWCSNIHLVIKWRRDRRCYFQNVLLFCDLHLLSIVNLWNESIPSQEINIPYSLHHIFPSRWYLSWKVSPTCSLMLHTSVELFQIWEMANGSRFCSTLLASVCRPNNDKQRSCYRGFSLGCFSKTLFSKN